MARKKMLKKIAGFDDWLRSEYESGKNMYDIGCLVGCSATTILNHLRRIGVNSRNTGDMNKGRKQPPHVAAITSARHKGKFVSEETRAKISKARKAGKHRSPNWKGGKRTGRTDGYVQVYKPEHPGSSIEGYVMEHRLVMESVLGRYLSGVEVVHHINGVRNDNRPENLQLFASGGEHISHHNKLRKGIAS